MGRVGESGNVFNDGSHQNQARSTLHPQHQQGIAFPPRQENDDYDDQHAAFPPQPEKVQAFPPQQQEKQTPASFPPTQESPFNEQMHMNVGLNNGVNMMNGNNFQQMPMPMPMPTPAPAPGGFQQTPIGGYIGINTEPWKTSLFDCFDDPENALITACFPCVTFGQIAEIIDQGQSSCATSGTLYTLLSCMFVPCILSCTYRTKMRDRFKLVESEGPDWLIHVFCEWCAICQEYRELKLRGYDPAIGWGGNAARLGMVNGIAMTAPVQPMMMTR